MRRSCCRPTHLPTEGLPRMLGDKKYRSVGFCHMLILDAAATEMDSSDVLEGNRLPRAEWTGSASCPLPCKLWRHASPSCSTQGLSMIGLLVLAVPWDLGLLPLTWLRVLTTFLLSESVPTQFFLFSLFSQVLDRGSKISPCPLLFSFCLLTRKVNPPSLACQILP